MRNDSQFREDATHIEETAHKEAADRTGIAGLAILARLPSIDFPRSFPPDSMHLFFENVIPGLVRHYRGIFFKTDPTRDGATGDNDQEQVEQLAPRGSRKRKRSGGTDTRRDQGAASGAKQLLETRKLKFKKTSDPWNVGPKVWERIGRDQEVKTYIYAC